MYFYTVHAVVVTNGVYETVVAVLLSIQHAILDEDGDGSQDERHKQIHVNEVPGAVELPGERRERGTKYITSYLVFSLHQSKLINTAGYDLTLYPRLFMLDFHPHCSQAQSWKVFIKIK